MTKEQTSAAAIIRVVLALVWGTGGLHPAIAQYVHPPPPPQAADFEQPPNDNHTHWRGPVIRAVTVKCWTAEPSEPAKLFGGEHGTQQAKTFVPTSDLTPSATQVDTSFHQTTFRSFSGGGKMSDLKPKDLPPGIFVSVKGHPILKVTAVQYPIQDHDPPLFGPQKTGVKVAFDFIHEPGNGECYLYVAVWVAVK